MKTIVLIIVALFTIQFAYTQVYATKAIKVCERIDAYPFGEPKTINVDVLLDLDKLQLTLSSVPDFCFGLKVESQKPINNGTQIRMSAICPKQKKCFIIAYFENSKLLTLEIRYTIITYKFLMDN